MGRCPVCGNEQIKGFVCDRCGFAPNADYEQYKTLSPCLPKGAKPISVRKAEWNKSHPAAPKQEADPVYKPDDAVKGDPSQTAPSAKEKTPPQAPASDRRIAAKKRIVCLLFWFFFGLLGVHHFYEKSTLRGFFHLGAIGALTYMYLSGSLGTEITVLTAAVILLLWVIDLFRILSRPTKYVI